MKFCHFAFIFYVVYSFILSWSKSMSTAVVSASRPSPRPASPSSLAPSHPLHRLPLPPASLPSSPPRLPVAGAPRPQENGRRSRLCSPLRRGRSAPLRRLLCRGMDAAGHAKPAGVLTLARHGRSHQGPHRPRPDRAIPTVLSCFPRVRSSPALAAALAGMLGWPLANRSQSPEQPLPSPAARPHPSSVSCQEEEEEDRRREWIKWVPLVIPCPLTPPPPRHVSEDVFP